MSVFLACKHAIQRARNLGPISMNRIPDLHARGMPTARLTPAGGLAIRAPAQRDKYRALATEMDSFRAAIGRQARLGGDPSANSDEIARMGLLVERFGAFGNCGELSAVAYHYLRDQDIPGKVGFIDWHLGNHQFVVAGLPDNLATARWPYDPYAAPAAWGDKAVWCDAWTTNCFDAWKPAVWPGHTRSILAKTQPALATPAARRTTSFTLLALSSCGRYRRT